MSKFDKAKDFFRWPDALLRVSSKINNQPMAVYDIETFKNFTCVVAIDGDGVHALRSDRDHVGDRIKRFFRDGVYYSGFNVFAFDNIVLEKLSNYPSANFTFSQRLIAGAIDEKQVATLFDTVPTVDLIDLRGPAEKVGLKGLAARSDAYRIQELPFDIDAELNEEQRNDVVAYCINDCVETHRFMLSKMDDIQLRHNLYEKYDLASSRVNYHRFISSKGASVAEKVLAALIERNTGTRPGKITDSFYSTEVMAGKDLVPVLSFNNKSLQRHYDEIKNSEISA